MIHVLLDHPWPLSASPNSGRVLLDFDALMKRNRGLRSVPFFTNEECANAFQGPQRNAFAQMFRVVQHLIRDGSSTCIATPIPAPAILSHSWMWALYETMHDSDDWRSPQIVVPQTRENDWNSVTELQIRLEVCGEVPASGPYERLLVVLEQYEDHPFARADADPWDLERLHPRENPHLGHPCRLPKPPELANLSLEEIDARMKHCRQEQGAKIYYLPESNWQLATVSKAAWREKGHGFPYQSSSVRHRSGWLDRIGRIWEWDMTESHWDVQEKDDYTRVSHTGDVLS
jgi:hypothetical protein